MALEFLFVGMGGFLGCCMRFGINRISNHFCISFPFGTLISNLIAGIAIGFILGMEQQSGALLPRTKLFLTTGLLGGLSTFSAFSLETVQMFGDGRYMLASGNILLNLCLSLLGTLFGIFLAKALIKGA